MHYLGRLFNYLFSTVKSNRIFSCLLLALCLLIVIPAAYADELEDVMEDRERIEERIEDEEEEIKELRTREEQLEAEINRLDRQMGEIENRIQQLSRQIEAKEQEIEETEKELEEAEEELDYRESLLKKRLRAMYEKGNSSYLEVLFSSTSFGEFLTRFNDLQNIADNDAELMAEVEERRDEILVMKNELEGQRAELQETRRENVDYKNELDRTMASRNQKRQELEELINEKEQAIAELEEEARKLDSIIEEMLQERRADDFSAPESLQWPWGNANYITSGFGYRTHPITGRTSFHGGIDIAPGRQYWPISSSYIGTPAYLKAAASGVVIFSGVQQPNGNYLTRAAGRDEYSVHDGLGSYGSLVMIHHGEDDHGRDFVTLYAHCHSRLVEEGEVVSRGQNIATIGSTGSSTGPHVHFEVRINGERKNPRHFLP